MNNLGLIPKSESGFQNGEVCSMKNLLENLSKVLKGVAFFISWIENHIRTRILMRSRK